MSHCRGMPQTHCPRSALSIQAVLRHLYKDLVLPASSSLSKHRGRIRTTQPTACSITNRNVKTIFSPHMPVHHLLQRSNLINPRRSHRALLLSLTATLQSKYRRRIPRQCRSLHLKERWVLNRSDENLPSTHLEIQIHVPFIYMSLVDLRTPPP